jgi:hypothetical protein
VDFTKLNYKTGVKNAKELLAKLVGEETAPIPAKSPKPGEDAISIKGRERPTQPSKSRPSTSQKETAPLQIPESPKKVPSMKSGAIFGGIVLFIVLLFAGGVVWGRGLFFSSSPTPTSTSTPEIRPTDTFVPTQIPDTPTPAIPQFYAEEFDQSNFWEQNWAREIKHGDANNSTFSIENGEVKWILDEEYLWVYYFYRPYTYTDVQLDVEFKNFTGPAGSYFALVCGYNEGGWYEFNIYGGQYELIRRGAAREELSKRGGGLSRFKFGTGVINRVSVICSSGELSILSNDGNPHPHRLAEGEDLGEGQVGIALSTDRDWPVSVQITSIRISEP